MCLLVFMLCSHNLYVSPSKSLANSDAPAPTQPTAWLGKHTFTYTRRYAHSYQLWVCLIFTWATIATVFFVRTFLQLADFRVCHFERATCCMQHTAYKPLCEWLTKRLTTAADAASGAEWKDARQLALPIVHTHTLTQKHTHKLVYVGALYSRMNASRLIALHATQRIQLQFSCVFMLFQLEVLQETGRQPQRQAQRCNACSARSWQPSSTTSHCCDACHVEKFSFSLQRHLSSGILWHCAALVLLQWLCVGFTSLP